MTRGLFFGNGHGVRLQSRAQLQHELDLENDDCADRGQLMTTLDAINGRYGKGTVQMASTGATEKVRE